jgi:hypothetical protein
MSRDRQRSARFTRWLRKVHLYVGLWGAALGLLFGATGFLMNHRAILKIPLEKAVQSSAMLALPDPAQRTLATPQEMAAWLQQELQFDAQQVRSKAEAPRRVTWGERELLQPARWTFSLNSPHRGVSAEYLVGNRQVKVETLDATLVGTLMRLHTSTGATALWVLLSDTLAGALIVQSITGLLLWLRMRAMWQRSSNTGLAGCEPLPSTPARHAASLPATLPATPPMPASPCMGACAAGRRDPGPARRLQWWW